MDEIPLQLDPGILLLFQEHFQKLKHKPSIG
jgi:hypothetical protein